MENIQDNDPYEDNIFEGIKRFFAGFILSLASHKFYNDAVKRSTGIAVLSFGVFMIFISILSTINLILGLGEIKVMIDQAYLNGSIPVITITNGIAESSGAEKYTFLEEEGMFLGIDVSSEFAEIDRTEFFQGFLLTQTELHVLNNGQYQRLPLNDLHTLMEQNPIVVDEKLIGEGLAYFGSIGAVVFLIVLLMWNIVVRFLYMVGVGLIIWGIVSSYKKDLGFNVILIIGSYAYLAAMMYTYTLQQLGVWFIFLHSLFMIAIWGLQLYLILNPEDHANTLRPEEIEEYEKPNLQLATWGIPFMTLGVLSILLPTNTYAWPLFAALTGVVGIILYYERSRISSML